MAFIITNQHCLLQPSQVTDSDVPFVQLALPDAQSDLWPEGLQH